MSSFAAGKYALGICDRSGFTYKLKDLVFEVQDGKRTGLRVGKDMLDPDHPQNFLGRYPVDDPQALLGARPDNRTDRNSLDPLYGFSTQTSLQASGQVGSVTVSVS